ncbi:MAG: hypothetical protein H6779_03890 [Candidatus Nomurabacteria bacterium]|nr:MAG: hypothetical protein H6779_03890 [Candidatus Nomurabacteria bacterium]
MNNADIFSFFGDNDDVYGENIYKSEIINQLLILEQGTIYRPDLDCLFVQTEKVEYSELNPCRIDLIGNNNLYGLFIDNNNSNQAFALVFFNFKSLLDNSLDIIDKENFIIKLLHELSDGVPEEHLRLILEFIEKNNITIPSEIIIDALKFGETVH